MTQSDQDNKKQEAPKKGFLLDMDGVVYCGSTLVQGADKFIETLKERKIPFLFLTNNSRSTRRDLALRLNRLGIDVAASEFYKDGKYELVGENKTFTTDELIDYFEDLVQEYPIISAENPTSEDFDASMVWGPLSGIRAYLGVRFQVK